MWERIWILSKESATHQVLDTSKSSLSLINTPYWTLDSKTHLYGEICWAGKLLKITELQSQLLVMLLMLLIKITCLVVAFFSVLPGSVRQYAYLAYLIILIIHDNDSAWAMDN